MRSRMAAGLAWAACYILYGLFYAGWFFHRPIRLHALRYSLVVMLLAGGFLLPPMAVILVRRIGRRRAGFAAGAMLLGLLLVYAVGSQTYYYTRLYPFDPILQKPPPLLSGHPREKQPGVFRVLALGGSTTANRDMPRETRYPVQLEQLLKEQYPARRIEVINAGKGWYTTQHSLINYVSYCRDWQPDLVVVMHGINDLYRSFTPARYSRGEYNVRWSHFYGPSARGARPPTFEAAWFDETFGKHWYASLRVRPCDVPLQQFRSLPEFQRNMASLVHFLKADGCRVLLVTQPSLYKSNMTGEELETLWFGRTFCVDDGGYWRQTFPSAASMRRAMDRYNAAVRRLAESLDVPLADADSRVPRDLIHFRDDVHYTAAGARQVAEVVAAEIHQSRLLNDQTSRRAVASKRALP